MMANGDSNRLLFARICAPDNLRAAWERVRAKRARGGLDRRTVEDFDADADRQLDQLRADLVSERYAPLPAQEFAVPKEGKSGEHRILALHTVRDKVAQEAVRRIIEPHFDRLFHDCSYGYRPGRGPARAVKRVSHYLVQEQRRWVASADIDDFFGSLDHQLLTSALRSQLKDEAVLRLILLWLQMGTVDGAGRWHDVYSGVRQGCVLSPLLANFYLRPFDQSISDQGFAMVRYADDLVLCCKERSGAERGLERASIFLQQRLRLKFNPNPRPIVDAEQGFVFLGVSFIGDTRAVAAAKLESAKNQLARLIRNEHEPVAALHHLNEAAGGWRRYYGAVVKEKELAPLEESLFEAVVNVIAGARSAGRISRREQAIELLGGLELLQTRPAKERADVIEALARRGFEQADKGGQLQSLSDSKSPRRRTGSRTDHTGNPHLSSPWSGGGIQSSPNPRAGMKGEHAALFRAGMRGPSVSPADDTSRPKGRYRQGVKAGASVASVVRVRKREQMRRFAAVSDLVINTPGLFVGKASQRLIVRHQRKTICEAPLERLGSVTFAGSGASLSTDAIGLCAERGTPIIFLSPSGQPLAVAQLPAWSDGEVALMQLKAIEQGAPAFDIARRIVRGKIRGQANLIKYFAKYRKRVAGDFVAVYTNYLAELEKLLAELESYSWDGDRELARGRLFSVEGRAAGSYWSLIGRILGPKITFEGRRRRGATDLVNSLLNYGYAVLQGRVWCAIVRAGLNPNLGFLHALEARRPSLVFDLMEEFRPCVVDRTVVTLLNRKQPLAADAAGRLTEQSRRLLLAALFERLSALVRLRRRERTLEEVIAHQAQALCNHLRGQGQFRPFSCKW